MERCLIAKASITVDAPLAKVRDAFVNPNIIRQYMFGTNAVSDKQGSSIVWKGEWKGKTHEDKGVILKLKTQRMISYSHFSSLSGLPDVPENYQTVTVELSSDENRTLVSLTQDGSVDEETRQHSEQNWGMLASLKKTLEK